MWVLLLKQLVTTRDFAGAPGGCALTLLINCVHLSASTGTIEPYSICVCLLTCQFGKKVSLLPSLYIPFDPVRCMIVCDLWQLVMEPKGC